MWYGLATGLPQHSGKSLRAVCSLCSHNPQKQGNQRDKKPSQLTQIDAVEPNSVTEPNGWGLAFAVTNHGKP